MGRTRSWLKPFMLLATFAVVSLGGALVNHGSTASAAGTVTVNAGGGAGGIAVELFRPAFINIAAGDTLNVVNDYEEPHTLSFIVNPADIPPGIEGLESPFGSSDGFNGAQSFSTGFLEKGDSASVTFPASGSYHFICLIHPGMTLDVEVGSSGSPTVVQPGADAFLNIGIDLGESAAASVDVPPPSEGADGTSTWTVPTGPSVPYRGGTVDVMRFMAPELQVNAGDTVVWSNDTGVPHTITFLPGPPPEDFNPFIETKPSQDFDASEVYNGIVSIAPEFGGIETYSLTFNEPGTYTYICVLHINQGMAGVITVGSGFNTISPPNTGDGGLWEESAAQSTGYWLMHIGLALLAGSIAAGGVVAARHR